MGKLHGGAARAIENTNPPVVCKGKSQAQYDQQAPQNFACTCVCMLHYNMPGETETHRVHVHPSCLVLACHTCKHSCSVPQSQCHCLSVFLDYGQPQFLIHVSCQQRSMRLSQCQQECFGGGPLDGDTRWKLPSSCPRWLAPSILLVKLTGNTRQDCYARHSTATAAAHC